MSDVERSVGQRRLDAVAGSLLTLYALWYVAQLAALLVSRDTYDSMQTAQDHPASRAALVLVILCALYHVTGGVLVLLAERSEWLAVRAPVRSGISLFVTLAGGIPAGLVVCWPLISGMPR